MFTVRVREITYQWMHHTCWHRYLADLVQLAVRGRKGVATPLSGKVRNTSALWCLQSHMQQLKQHGVSRSGRANTRQVQSPSAQLDFSCKLEYCLYLIDNFQMSVVQLQLVTGLEVFLNQNYTNVWKCVLEMQGFKNTVVRGLMFFSRTIEFPLANSPSD